MMEDVYVNMEEVKGVSSNHTAVRSSSRCLCSVTVCLGLLSVFLLVGLVTLCVHYHRVGAEFNAIKDNLTKSLQTSDEKLSSMTEERDQLTANLTATNRKLQCLTAQKKTCPSGWRLFRCGCYFFSAGAASWERSRQDCRGRGADLVVIDSCEEQEFVTATINRTSWIGLNDRDREGSWKWADGTPLDSTSAYWRDEQPDNGGGDPQWGEEDCVHVTAGQDAKKNWNDRRCDASHRWICEKMADY